jgi:hypothetical protein
MIFGREIFTGRKKTGLARPVSDLREFMAVAGDRLQLGPLFPCAT